MIALELLKGLDITWKKGALDVEIKGIAYDSRLVDRDFLFVAIRGFAADGHDYIKDAVNRGATVVVAEHPIETSNSEQSGSRKGTAFIGVPDSRKALALISSAFYGHPSKSLSLIGITGTNGKTTTSFITKNIISAGGEKAGLLGTICYMTGDGVRVAINTTPESLDLQRYLREMLYNNMKYAVLEVSSHALALSRVEGCSFRVAAFTNFSQDHLDFHGTMEEYFNAKSRLFDYLNRQGTAVLNRDDPMIRKLEPELKCNVITCGITERAVIRAENIGQRNTSGSGLSFDIATPSGSFRVDSVFRGYFNVYNILMAAGIAYALGFDIDVIQQGINSAEPVEGRFESIDEGQDFLCIVDYAHTEDALRKLIQEARRITKCRIITVFGCGGDRDKAKRPLMGAAASELSDYVIVTTDNPRWEDPGLIMRDIIQGMKKDNYTVIQDREEAIREAVSMAKEGDTVLIAGKGHENYQEVKGERYHFSDKEVVKKAIKEINKR